MFFTPLKMDLYLCFYFRLWPTLKIQPISESRKADVLATFCKKSIQNAVNFYDMFPLILLLPPFLMLSRHFIFELVAVNPFVPNTFPFFLMLNVSDYTHVAIK